MIKQDLLDKLLYFQSKYSVTDTAVLAATEFIFALDSIDDSFLKTTWLACAEDGEVCFLWRNATNHFEVGFYSTTYSYYASIKGQDYFGDDFLVKEGLTSVIACLKLFHSEKEEFTQCKK